jgi:hypothetical protein
LDALFIDGTGAACAVTRAFPVKPRTWDSFADLQHVLIVAQRPPLSSVYAKSFHMGTKDEALRP